MKQHTGQPKVPKLLSECNTQNEAEQWLNQQESSKTEHKKTSPLFRYLTYFWGPIPWVIEGMLILTGIFRFWQCFFILLFMLIANALITIWLVFRKERR